MGVSIPAKCRAQRIAYVGAGQSEALKPTGVFRACLWSSRGWGEQELPNALIMEGLCRFL